MIFIWRLRFSGFSRIDHHESLMKTVQLKPYRRRTANACPGGCFADECTFVIVIWEVSLAAFAQ